MDGCMHSHQRLTIISCPEKERAELREHFSAVDRFIKKKKRKERKPCQHHHPHSSLSFTDLSLSIHGGTSLLMAFKVGSHRAVKITETGGDIQDRD